jgi:hypothetical protein
VASPSPVDPVKLFVAVLWKDPAVLQRATLRLSRIWGEIDCTGPDRPFDLTDYYEPEMGPALTRRLVSFHALSPPEALREAKLTCNLLEDELAGATGRKVNLDIGYLDHHKIVLGSVKAAGQKIHLGDGVFADLVARYQKGRFQPFDWTFPDFKDGRYDPELKEIRTRYLDQLRALRQGS